MNRSVVAAPPGTTLSNLLTQRRTADTPKPQHAGHSVSVHAMAALQGPRRRPRNLYPPPNVTTEYTRGTSGALRP